MYPTQTPIRPLLILLMLALLAPAGAQTQNYGSSDGTVNLQAPSAFAAIQPRPESAILAIEVASHGVSLLVSTSEPVEIETERFAQEMKKKLQAGGAQIVGTVTGNLKEAPAVSFLVGGVKPGKESLFVFNTREDKVYAFILNYPEGRRQDAAELWDSIAPTLVFTPKEKPKDKK